MKRYYNKRLAKGVLFKRGLKSIFNQSLFFDIEPMEVGSIYMFNKAESKDRLFIKIDYSDHFSKLLPSLLILNNISDDYSSIGLDLKNAINKYENEKKKSVNNSHTLKRAV